MQQYETEEAEEKKARWYQKISHYEKFALVFGGGIGLVFCMILVEVIVHETHFAWDYPISRGIGKVLVHTLREIGIACISGAVIGVTLEITGLLDFAKGSLIAAMTSHKYLQKLTHPEIQKVKRDCNRMIWEKRGLKPDFLMSESLMKLENDLNDHLSKPYYSSYEIEIECIKVHIQTEFADDSLPNIEVVKKVIKTKYVIYNPDVDPTTESIDVSLYFQKIDSVGHDKIFQLKKFLVTIDDKPTENKKSDLKYSDITDVLFNGKYNSLISLVGQNGEKLEFTYQNTLEVDMESVRYIIANDSTFHRRMKRAAKNVSLDYTFNDPSVNLFADCFVTTFNEKNNLKVNVKTNNVRIDTHDEWLLPGNGFAVFHAPNPSIAPLIQSPAPQAATAIIERDSAGMTEVSESLPNEQPS